MKIFLCLIVLIVLTCQKQCLSLNKEMALYRSEVYLELLAKAEILFVKRLKESLPEIEGSPSTMASEYLQVYLEHTKNLPNFTSESDLDRKARASTWNIFSVFQTVRRWILYLKPFKELLRETPVLEPLQIYPEYTSQDLNESMLDMLHILHAYNSDISKAVDGIIQDVDTGTGLSAQECLEIGNFALAKLYYALSIQFHEQALRKNRNLPRTALESALNASIKEHDRMVGKQRHLHPYQKQYLFNRKIQPLIERYGEKYKDIRIYQRVLIAREDPSTWPKMTEDQKQVTFGSGSYEVPALLDLCLHNTLPNLWDNAMENKENGIPLFCWHESTIHPFFSINPLKMELLSATPEVVRIHELLPLSKIQAAKEYLAHKSYHNGTEYVLIHLIDSVIVEDDLKIFPIEHKLLSAYKEWDFKNIITNRIHAYTPGAKLQDHFDDLTEDVSTTVVSLLYYLEEPALGGETFFSYPHLKIKPVKGSAIYFISNDASGELDYDAIHSSCPLIVGRKAVFSKILHLKTREMTCQNSNRRQRLKKFPHSKILNQKLYPRIKKYYPNYRETLFEEYLSRHN